MSVTLPKGNPLSEAIEAEIEHRGFAELYCESTGRTVYLFAPETLEGYSRALTDERLQSAVRQSVSELRDGQGVSIDPTKIGDSEKAHR